MIRLTYASTIIVFFAIFITALGIVELIKSSSRKSGVYGKLYKLFRFRGLLKSQKMIATVRIGNACEDFCGLYFEHDFVHVDFICNRSFIFPTHLKIPLACIAEVSESTEIKSGRYIGPFSDYVNRSDTPKILRRFMPDIHRFYIVEMPALYIEVWGEAGRVLSQSVKTN
jgi:hypothetical protein